MSDWWHTFRLVNVQNLLQSRKTKGRHLTFLWWSVRIFLSPNTYSPLRGFGDLKTYTFVCPRYFHCLSWLQCCLLYRNGVWSLIQVCSWHLSIVTLQVRGRCKSNDITPELVGTRDQGVSVLDWSDEHLWFEITKAFDCVDHNKLWEILKEMGIPDHLTCLLRNLYEVRKQQFELDMEQQTGSK